jgi:deoxyribonuclease V
MSALPTNQRPSPPFLVCVVMPVANVADYEPGQFYRRELPCVLAVLSKLSRPPSLLMIDGYVWLGNDSKPGMGARLFEELGCAIPVIGIAKTRFRDAAALEICRGNSLSPLFITAAGIDVQLAANHVKNMHGPHRIPTLLKRVDQLCRGRKAPSSHSV